MSNKTQIESLDQFKDEDKVSLQLDIGKSCFESYPCKHNFTVESDQRIYNGLDSAYSIIPFLRRFGLAIPKHFEYAVRDFNL